MLGVFHVMDFEFVICLASTNFTLLISNELMADMPFKLGVVQYTVQGCHILAG